MMVPAPSKRQPLATKPKDQKFPKMKEFPRENGGNSAQTSKENSSKDDLALICAKNNKNNSQQQMMMAKDQKENAVLRVKGNSWAQGLGAGSRHQQGLGALNPLSVGTGQPKSKSFDVYVDKSRRDLAANSLKHAAVDAKFSVDNSQSTQSGCSQYSASSPTTGGQNSKRQPLSVVAGSKKPLSQQSQGSSSAVNATSRSSGSQEHSQQTQSNSSGYGSILNESLSPNKVLGLPAKRRPLAPLSELENVNISMESDSASLTAFQGSQDDTSTVVGSPMSIDRSSFSAVSESDDQENVDPARELSFPDGDSETEFMSAFDLESEYMTARSQKQINLDFIECQPPYTNDIYQYMRKREIELRPKSYYMRKQPEITPEMRFILVDWLIDVTVEYELRNETLHLCVSIIDRILSVMQVPRVKLQLVGTTAVMISAKFEEIYPPEPKDYVYITDDTYSIHQVLIMEAKALQALEFNVSGPTSHWFCARFLKLCRASETTSCLANYLLELALLDYRYLTFCYSQVAAGAVCLANLMTGPTPWPALLEKESGIELREIYPIVLRLLESFKESPKKEHKAVYERYKVSKLKEVALLVAPDSLPSIG